MARVGQRVVAGDRLADRIGVGVLIGVFPPKLVNAVGCVSGGGVICHAARTTGLDPDRISFTRAR
ncbi:MAG: hypothetical protein ACRDTC_22225, partial [Pseudonocardiaceae bacterium]